MSYTLEGTDASSFTIYPWTGQLHAKAALDYETTSSYLVTVKATDTEGRSVSISVTINVTNQPVEIFGPTRVEFSEGDFVYSPVVTENYKVEPGESTFKLSGTDARHFTLSRSLGRGTHGRLIFNEAPDYEAPRDSGRSNVYDTTINASKETSGTTHRTSHNVQVVVTNYDEGPFMTGPEAVNFVEQTTGPVAR